MVNPAPGRHLAAWGEVVWGGGYEDGWVRRGPGRWSEYEDGWLGNGPPWGATGTGSRRSY